MRGSKESLKLAKLWQEENNCNNLLTTVGVHPHDAKTYTPQTTSILREMIKENPLVVSVGECGLDYNRNFSTKEQQRYAYREQVKLACELQMPLFLHEREAHEDLLKILDGVTAENSRLPPIVVHCFTGTEEEALTYTRRGYYLGFTGTICKRDRGAHLRDLLPKIPLERIMIETDAPYMNFKKGRKSSEPIDVVDVARKIGQVLAIPFEEVATTTFKTTSSFFRLD